MGSKKQKTADPVTTANAQTQANKDAAYYNAQLENMDQFTPYGSLTYKNIGDVNNPKWQSTINLSPEQQQLYNLGVQGDTALSNLGNEQIARIRESVSSPYSYDGLPSLDNTAAQDAIYSRLEPKFAQDEEALRTRLINQGIAPGSEAYNREMNTFNQAKNDARTQAILSGQQYNLAARNQGINEYNAIRNAPLNEYNAFTSGAQVQNPTFTSGGNSGISPTDISGITNAYNNARQASSNNTMNSLFGLGGQLGGSFLGSDAGSAAVAGLFAASDIRLKENIKTVGEENGYPIYEFNYINDPDRTYIGVMAQDVEKVKPEAVIESEGFKKVNYDMIGVKMREVKNDE
jgi:hypothetical protein